MYAYINTSRVTPEIVSASHQALKTNIQWIFDRNVENRITNFIVEAIPHGGEGEGNMPVSESTAPTERFASLSSLKPSTTYHLTVAAEYKDGSLARSDERNFTIPGTFF